MSVPADFFVDLPVRAATNSRKTFKIYHTKEDKLTRKQAQCEFQAKRAMERANLAKMELLNELKKKSIQANKEKDAQKKMLESLQTKPLQSLFSEYF